MGILPYGELTVGSGELYDSCHLPAVSQVIFSRYHFLFIILSFTPVSLYVTENRSRFSLESFMVLTVVVSGEGDTWIMV